MPVTADSVHPDTTEPFETRLQDLADELSAAIQWGRPSILFAVYRSELVRRLAQERLEQDLERLGQTSCLYFVTKTNYDIPLLLRDHPKRREAVFSILGIRWGGGRGYSNAYRALNLHREYLVEGSLRCIFWLTPPEARQLPRHAPDFWAFRHRVFEFLDFPSRAQLPPDLFPDEPGTVYLAKRTAFEQARQEPQRLLDLARICHRLGFYEEALGYYRKAARLLPQDLSLLKATAELHLGMRRPEQAARLARILARAGSPETGLWKQIGQTWEQLGQPARARRAFAAAFGTAGNAESHI
jgi:tetratricopeptide (TPR) repeat protein